MTENEAQKWLERFEWDDSEETSEALATICEALQEYPKFKAIGTIDEVREPNEVKEILINFLIHQALIERSNILTEKEKSELYSKACELGREKLKDNSTPFFENWRSEQTREEDTDLNENRLGELTKQKLIEKVQAMTLEEQKATAEGLPTEIIERELERRRVT